MRLIFLKDTKDLREGRKKFYRKDIVCSMGNIMAERYIKKGDAKEFVDKSPEKEIAKSKIKNIKENGEV